MSQPHKVVIGRVYFTDASSPYEAMAQAIERDKTGRETDVDAIQVHVTINPDDN